MSSALGGTAEPWTSPTGPDLWAWEGSGPISRKGWESAPVRLPPAYGGAGRAGASSWIEGVNYADPLGAGLPLLHVRGYTDFKVSDHFRVRDFATRDGAPYVRIAPSLVDGLERMRAAVGPVTVISGYRHPRYNAMPAVGGARYSRHQSGQAADVWSASATTLEMARAAVEAMGCAIGIGLGENTIHVDVRGYLETWTYPGAPIGSQDFSRWVRTLCAGNVVAPPPVPVWRAGYEGGARDEGETFHRDAALEGGSAEPGSEPDAPASASDGSPETERTVARRLSGFVRRARANGARGVVVVGLGPGETVETAPLEERSRYVLDGSPELGRLGLEAVTRWARSRPADEVFVYAVRRPDGTVDVGVAPLVAPPAAPERPRAAWLVVLGTYEDVAQARQDLGRYGGALRSSGLGPVLQAEGGPGGTRYAVVVGPFSSQEDADRASVQARDALPPGSGLSPSVAPAPAN